MWFPHPTLNWRSMFLCFFRKSINEKASFSYETNRMLEIQTLALQITDNVPVFLFLFIWHSGSNIPCWCFTNSTLTWRERTRRGLRTGNRSPVSEDSVASFQMCKTMNFKSTVFHPTVGHCPQQWGIFTWSLKQKRKKKLLQNLRYFALYLEPPVTTPRLVATEVPLHFVEGSGGWRICVFMHTVPKKSDFSHYNSHDH